MKVYYLTYTNVRGPAVLEELALDLIGQKMAFNQLLYGEDISGAIVPDMDDNMVIQILRAIERQERPEKIRQLFGSARGRLGFSVGCRQSDSRHSSHSDMG